MNLKKESLPQLFDHLKYFQLQELAENHKAWAIDYEYCSRTNEFTHKDGDCGESALVDKWFSKPLV